MSLSSDERHFNHLLLKNKKTTTVSILLEALKCLLWISVSRWLPDLTKLHASFIPEEFFIRSVMISRFHTRSKNQRLLFSGRRNTGVSKHNIQSLSRLWEFGKLPPSYSRRSCSHSLKNFLISYFLCVIDEISSAYTSRYLFAGYERFKVWTDLFRVERQH